MDIIKPVWPSRSDHRQLDRQAKTCWLEKSAMY